MNARARSRDAPIGGSTPAPRKSRDDARSTEGRGRLWKCFSRRAGRGRCERNGEPWRRWESNPGPKMPCSCFYVRSRRFVSSRVAPIGGLSSAPSTCLFSLRVRWPGGRLASLVTPFRRRWRASRSDDSQICCLGSESNCVIVRNYRCPGGFTWVLSHHGTQQRVQHPRRNRSPPRLGERCEAKLGVQKPPSRALLVRRR